MQLNVKDISKMLSVSEKTVYRWIREKHLPAYRINDQYRFNRTEILEWATASRIRLSPDSICEPDSTNLPLLQLDQALLLGGIHYHVQGTNLHTVLKAVVDRMPLPEEVDKTFLLQVLLTREALGSTGIGDGIAIPHIRNPIVLHIPHPLISLCFLDTPIDFRAMDGKPVYVLFTLVSPTVRGHLALLSKLSFALRDPHFKSLILQASAPEDILSTVRRIEASMPISGQDHAP